MKSFRYFFIIISVLFYNLTGYASGNLQIIHNGNLIYFAHTVVVKYKNLPGQNLTKASNIESRISRLLKDYNVKSVSRTFSIENNDAQRIGLDKIMTVNYSKNLDPLYAAAKMKELPGIEWAEPKYIRRIDFVPNDTSYNSTSQWNLFQINSQSAWDISKGDTSVIIGIVDTGVDWPHPDIRANMWYGIGYDFGGLNGTPDNNPIEDNPYHGTFVAGVASAVTNNITGIASIGFNTHLMAVKVAREDVKDSVTGEPYIVYGFKGIVYAADHGAKVINCSWGGSGYSNMEQEVIYYAISKGALVVAAAGNDNLNEKFYPASYDGVLSVAATSLNDIKASFSNFGYNVDVSAPGQNIYSTWQPDTYTHGSGTSFSTPLVSGLAGLVFARFPNYSPLQVAEQIRVNSDNIDAKNPGYQNLLGYGRIDAYKTLNNTNSVSIRAYNVQFSDSTNGGNGDGNLQPGENVAVRIKLKNYLNPANNVSVSLQSLNSFVTVENGNYNVGSIGTLDTADNYSNPFIIKIADNVPYNDTIALKFNYSADNYTDYQFAMAPVNSTFKTQSSNDIIVTITSQGNIGFNDFPNNLEGEGFKFMNGSNLLFEGALMFGTSPVKLSDEARDASGLGKDTSFQIVEPINITNQSDISSASAEGHTVFNDNGSGADKLGITVDLRSYSFNDANNKNSVILNYNFTNTSNTDISNFYSGLFFDWDLVESSGDSDVVNYDNEGNLGYIYHLGGNPDTYVGTALISSDKYGFWAIANGGDSQFQIYDGFSHAEKWQTLSSGIGKSSAGPTDISEVTSSGPFSIPAGKSVNVAFAITAGNNLDELRTNISNARDIYNNQLANNNGGGEVPLTYKLGQNYPNPFNPGTKIDYEIPEPGRVTIRIYNVLGKLVKTLIDEDKQPGKYTLKFNPTRLASGVYFYQLTVNSFTSTKKLVFLK
jgi:serine protease